LIVTIIVIMEVFGWTRSRGFYSLSLRGVFHVKIHVFSFAAFAPFIVVIVVVACCW